MGRSTDTAGPYRAVAIDLGSDTTLAPGCRGFTLGGAGDVKVDYAGGGTAILLGGRMAGIDYAAQISKIYSTANGTTATGVVALY